MKKIVLSLAYFYSAAVLGDAEIASVNKKVSALKARLSYVNSLGLQCDTKMEAQGVKGINSTECNNYLKIIKSDYLKNTFSGCPELISWYEAKRRFIFSNPNFASQQPEKADELLNSMKAVQDSCNSDTYQENFPYMIETLTKIRDLS
ncbi:MAG TPA: hypothetical protein VLC79_09830 [Cellvibrio sp.]|nr:hypothetical protein [Cellvibrio sp.]